MADVARGERLRYLRDGLHLSQETAAHRIGVSVKTLRAWEKGGRIKWRNAKRVGQLYDVDPESLVSRDGEAGEPPATDAEILGRLEAGQARLLAEIGKVQRQLQALQGSQRRPSRRREGSRNG